LDRLPSTESSEKQLTRFEFVVPGDCVPWARAGGGKTGHRFTPPRQAKYMAALKLICSAAMRGAKPLEGPICLDVRAVYAWPKSMPARKRGYASMWRTGRPDIDNLSKLVGDALNGVAWLDDAQIASLNVCKVYSDMPGLRVRIEALG
jgi:Holliday junction resolvase RusA-like endonuclease